jgi:hypothetical protein
VASRKNPPAAPSTALVVHGSSQALDKGQKKLLAEALRRAEEARDTMEDALVDFGRWILVNVFDDDADAALDGKRDNPVWHELVARAGGPTLRLSRKLLYVAVQIAAHDKRITDETWRGLDSGRKELLLPLGDERLMRKAAQHVVAMKLSARATRQYVQGLAAESGKARQVRLTGPRLVARLRAVREGLLDGPGRRRVERLLGDLDPASREALRGEAEALAAFAREILKRIG